MSIVCLASHARPPPPTPLTHRRLASSWAPTSAAWATAAASAFLRAPLHTPLPLIPSRRCGGDLDCIMTVANATYTSLYDHIFTHQNATTIAVLVYSAFLFPNASLPFPSPISYNLMFNMTLRDSARSAQQAKLGLDCAILRARGGSGARCSVSTRSYPSVPNRVSKCGRSCAALKLFIFSRFCSGTM